MTAIAIQLGAILRKDAQLEFSYRLQFLMTFLGIFMDLAMFFMLAKFLGSYASVHLKAYGGDYFSFVAMGISFGRYQWISLHTFSQSLREQQVMGTLEMTLASPVRPETMVLGGSLWSYVIGTFEVAVYLLMGSLFFRLDLSHANFLSVFVVIIMTILAMSPFGILSASFILVLKRGDPVAWVFATVSELLAGVYYPTEILPKYLKFASNLLPITHSLQAVRLAALKGATLTDLLPQLGALSLFAVILLPFSLFAFRRAMEIARRDGTLSQY